MQNVVNKILDAYLGRDIVCKNYYNPECVQNEYNCYCIIRSKNANMAIYHFYRFAEIRMEGRNPDYDLIRTMEGLFAIDGTDAETYLKNWFCDRFNIESLDNLIEIYWRQ